MWNVKKDEEKRSKLWQIITITATSIIILVLVFFITKPFVKNPLEGTWTSVKADYTITVHEEEITLQAGDFEVDLQYTLDKKEKTIAIHMDEEARESLTEVSDGKLSEEEVEHSVDMLISTFSYSIDDDTLTLTERECGDQLIYTRK